MGILSRNQHIASNQAPLGTGGRNPRRARQRYRA